MTKNLYFRSVIRRRNLFKDAIFGFFYSVCSWPRLLIEVFIRKNFGQRYFSFASVVTVFVILGLFPLVLGKTITVLLNPTQGYSYGEAPSLWGTFVTWYLYLFAFLYFGYKRSQEVKINPSTYDFERFSLYSGEVDSRFFGFKLFGKFPSIRQVEILYEPAPFLAGGLLLCFIGQALGLLLVLTSIAYGLSYVGAYRQGDNFVLDKIDEIIMNEELENSFVDDMDAANARGVRFYARKPKSEELRRKLADAFIEEEEPVTEAL